MTDAQWLAAMSRYRNEREDETRGWRMVGGAIELSRGLEKLVREDLGRLARLVERMESSLNPAYFEAILNGLTRHKEAARPGTLDQVCGVLRRITDIGVGVSEMVLADAVGALSDEDVPEDIVRVLCDIAENATDPEADRHPKVDPWLDVEDRNPA